MSQDELLNDNVTGQVTLMHWRDFSVVVCLYGAYLNTASYSLAKLSSKYSLFIVCSGIEVVP